VGDAEEDEIDSSSDDSSCRIKKIKRAFVGLSDEQIRDMQ